MVDEVTNREDRSSGEKGGFNVGKEGLDQKGGILHKLFCGFIKWGIGVHDACSNIEASHW